MNDETEKPFEKKMIKTPEDLPQDLQEQLDKLGLTNAIDWSHGLTPNDILYLLDHCPFIQVVSGDSREPQDVEIIKAPSGWDVHYYGDAMSTSPGKLLFADAEDIKRILKEEDDDEGGEGGGGKGTIYQQAFDTAAFIVALARKKGWQGLHIVDGHPRMEWAAWVAALDSGLNVSGFTPTKQDEAKYQRLKRSKIDEEKILVKKNKPR